jgi:hypothetical protein
MASLLWIRQTIEESEGSYHPVTAILQISYRATDKSKKNETITTEDLKKNLLQKVERALSRISAPPIRPGDRPRIFTWINRHHEPCSQTPVHFVTHDTYSNLFKAEVMKVFFRQFNAEHRTLGEIFFLISKPLDYLGTIFPTKFQYGADSPSLSPVPCLLSPLSVFHSQVHLYVP